jgi:hypothetical protein
LLLLLITSSLDWIILIIFDEQYVLWSSSLRSFMKCSISSSLLGSKYSEVSVLQQRTFQFLL